MIVLTSCDWEFTSFTYYSNCPFKLLEKQFSRYLELRLWHFSLCFRPEIWENISKLCPRRFETTWGNRDQRLSAIRWVETLLAPVVETAPYNISPSQESTEISIFTQGNLRLREGVGSKKINATYMQDWEGFWRHISSSLGENAQQNDFSCWSKMSRNV